MTDKKEPEETNETKLCSCGAPLDTLTTDMSDGRIHLCKKCIQLALSKKRH